MDTNNQWPQGIGIGLVKPIEIPKPSAALERKPRPQKERALNCPRCRSTNTKFCYYNNYSLSQPRYLCKTCRRYWTEGGTLRNVPVGGGSRKNKRSSSSTSNSSSPAATVKKLPDLSHLTSPGFSHQNPKIHDGQDLNLAYPPTGSYASAGLFELIQLSNYNENNNLHPNTSNNISSSSHTPALELLKSSGIPSRGLMSSLISMPFSDSNSVYSSVIPMQEFKQKLNFSMEGFENGYGNLNGVVPQESNSARLFIPHENLRPVSMSSDQYNQQQNRGQEAKSTTGYWNGMLGGGSW